MNYRFDQIAENINVRVMPGDTELDRYVGLEHLDPESLKIRRWGSPNDVIGQKLRFWKGDIIYGRRRAYQRKLVVADYEGICSAHAMVLRAKPDVCLPEFLPFFMQSEIFHQRALDISVGSLSPTINWSALARQEFLLPPIDEQRRIAELLWAAEDVVTTTTNLIELISKVKAAVRRGYFSSGGDSKILLKDLCEQRGIQIGPFRSQLHASDYVSNGIPVIMPANMTDDKIDERDISRITPAMADRLSQHKILPGDILLPRRGELDRRAFIRTEQKGWLCGTGSLRVRIKTGINPRAVFHALASSDVVSWIKNHAVGTTMPNINATIVSNIPVSLPAEDKVDEIVEVLEQFDISLELARKKREADIRLKKEILKHPLG